LRRIVEFFMFVFAALKASDVEFVFGDIHIDCGLGHLIIVRHAGSSPYGPVHSVALIDSPSAVSSWTCGTTRGRAADPLEGQLSALPVLAGDLMGLFRARVKPYRYPQLCLPYSLD
jgi:hypothetical protein